MSVLDEQAAELKRAWLDEAREGGQADSYAGKRSATRFVWQRQLEVTVPGNGGQTYRATAREISEIGIRFFCRDEIELFSHVQVSLSGETASVPLIVRHCTRTVNGYVVGCEFPT